MCKRIDSYPEGTGVLERIFGGVSVYYNYTGEVDCFQLDDDPHGMSGWNWQVSYNLNVHLLHFLPCMSCFLLDFELDSIGFFILFFVHFYRLAQRW